MFQKIPTWLVVAFSVAAVVGAILAMRTLTAAEPTPEGDEAREQILAAIGTWPTWAARQVVLTATDEPGVWLVRGLDPHPEYSAQRPLVGRIVHDCSGGRSGTDCWKPADLTIDGRPGI